MLPGPLQVGDVLAGRYQLLDPVAAEGPCSLWRARDDVLARDVAVRAMPMSSAPKRALAEHFLAAASRASQVTHPGLVRVYDAATEDRPKGRVAYLIREWVEGEPLDEHLLRVGELTPPDAADLLRQVADALTAAHAAGLVHGRVHPGNVLVTRTGRVRLTDAAVAAAAHGDATPSAPDEAAVRADTRDAAAVLYALLTTHWPTGTTPQPSGSLPASPLVHGHAPGPHQLRAAVSRQLDHVVLRALDPGQVPALPPLTTPGELAEAADRIAAQHPVDRPAEAGPRTPGWVRRHALLLFGVVAVLVFGLTGWLLGLSVGKLNRPAGAVDAIVASASPVPSGASPPATFDLTRLPIRDFDPAGDGQENPDQVHNAVDLDPTTAWLTSRYTSATFGGLKPGVGLLLDLGRVADVHQVQVGFTAPGAKVELRIALVPPSSYTDTTVVASSTSGAQVATLQPGQTVRTRFVLVWITSLPKDGPGYRVGIAEIAVR